MKVQARKRISMVKGLEGTIAQHQDEIKTLQQQLVETRRALVEEKQTREMLAQDMKRSFMRGVCALNLEAMQVCTRTWLPPQCRVQCLVPGLRVPLDAYVTPCFAKLCKTNKHHASSINFVML
jgi:hypothetical protein